MPTSPTPQIPAPYRLLTDDECEAPFAALQEAAAAYGQSFPYAAAMDMVQAVLATVGVFMPPPEPEPDTCTAQYLPTDPELHHGSGLHGQWQQCAEEPGHAGRHGRGGIGWADDAPGAVRAS